MGWIRARLGESNTMIGAGLVYAVLLQAFPQHAALTHAVAGVLGIGGIVTPKA